MKNVLTSSFRDRGSFRRRTARTVRNAKGEKTAYVGKTLSGKPQVEGLGYAFLMRNYRADLGKWQTADPLGYPDGWNQLAYCGNGVTDRVDLWGCEWKLVEEWNIDSTGDWVEVSRTAPSYEELWGMLCASAAWCKPGERKSELRIVFNDLVAHKRNYIPNKYLGEYWKFETIAEETISLYCLCAIKDFSDKSTLEILLRLGVGIVVATGSGKSTTVRQIGQLAEAESLEELVEELWKKIQDFGQDDEVVVDFGDIVRQRKTTSNMGYVYIYEE